MPGETSKKTKRRDSILKQRQVVDVNVEETYGEGTQKVIRRRVSFHNVKTVQAYAKNDHSLLDGSPIKQKINETMGSDGVLTPGRSHVSGGSSTLETPLQEQTGQGQVMANQFAAPIHMAAFDVTDDATVDMEISQNTTSNNTLDMFGGGSAPAQENHDDSTMHIFNRKANKLNTFPVNERGDHPEQDRRVFGSGYAIPSAQNSTEPVQRYMLDQSLGDDDTLAMIPPSMLKATTQTPQAPIGNGMSVSFDCDDTLAMIPPSLTKPHNASMTSSKKAAPPLLSASFDADDTMAMLPPAWNRNAPKPYAAIPQAQLNNTNYSMVDMDVSMATTAANNQSLMNVSQDLLGGGCGLNANETMSAEDTMMILGRPHIMALKQQMQNASANSTLLDNTMTIFEKAEKPTINDENRPTVNASNVSVYGGDMDITLAPPTPLSLANQSGRIENQQNSRMDCSVYDGDMDMDLTNQTEIANVSQQVQVVQSGAVPQSAADDMDMDVTGEVPVNQSLRRNQTISVSSQESNGSGYPMTSSTASSRHGSASSAVSSEAASQLSGLTHETRMSHIKREAIDETILLSSDKSERSLVDLTSQRDRTFDRSAYDESMNAKQASLGGREREASGYASSTREHTVLERRAAGIDRRDLSSLSAVPARLQVKSANVHLDGTIDLTTPKDEDEVSKRDDDVFTFTEQQQQQQAANSSRGLVPPSRDASSNVSVSSCVETGRRAPLVDQSSLNDLGRLDSSQQILHHDHKPSLANNTMNGTMDMSSASPRMTSATSRRSLLYPNRSISNGAAEDSLTSLRTLTARDVSMTFSGGSNHNSSVASTLNSSVSEHLTTLFRTTLFEPRAIQVMYLNPHYDQDNAMNEMRRGFSKKLQDWLATEKETSSSSLATLFPQLEIAQQSAITKMNPRQLNPVERDAFRSGRFAAERDWFRARAAVAREAMESIKDEHGHLTRQIEISSAEAALCKKAPVMESEIADLERVLEGLGGARTDEEVDELVAAAMDMQKMEEENDEMRRQLNERRIQGLREKIAIARQVHEQTVRATEFLMGKLGEREANRARVRELTARALRGERLQPQEEEDGEDGVGRGVEQVVEEPDIVLMDDSQ